MNLAKTLKSPESKTLEQKLLSLGVLVSYGNRLVPTNSGVILFGSETVRAHFLDRVDIDGGILPAIDEVLKFIGRNTRLVSEIKSPVRQDIPAYLDIALREVLINAISHADYSTGTRVFYPIPEWQEIGPVLRVTFVPHSITTQTHTQSEQTETPKNVSINKRQQWFINQLKQGIQCNPTSIVKNGM